MSHRKFEAPRHGSLGFNPRRRCKHHRGRVKAFPVDDEKKDAHLTCFMAYKAGMTHIARDVDKPGAGIHKKEVVEAVTVLEAPPMIGVGLVGYVPTPRGLRSLTTVWAGHLGEDMKRRMYKNWYRSKKKAFTKYAAKYESKNEDIEKEFERISKYCTVVRLICHTQMNKLKLRQRKAHIAEIQINGGSIEDKVAFGKALFEKEIPIESVFAKDEMVDTISITKGHGYTGVIARFGVTRLPRKTHRGLRKVACIGSWHPARVRTTVPRAGQLGYHHRTETNKKIYRIGKKGDEKSCSTDQDLTVKGINPLGGFPHYGLVNEDWLLIKGGVPGVKKRLVTLRKSLHERTSRMAKEEINIKFIDTSSKWGHGRFQTAEEKEKVMGKRKA
mmetsp:Transcript_7756/g.13633  ORF Transcript_7756/g.13633 Transcript_7756/m.13633 type:complete len:386 (+) Transcript_7756:82-1239(+)